MDIVIHGTKGGRKIFTPNKISGLLDVTSNNPSTSSIGKEAYAIRVIETHTIFSKYKIIRDVLGDKRTGFVAFSLFVPCYRKLSGAYIIDLLEDVSKEYCNRYIKENNLGNELENWDFITKVKDELKPVDEHILSGNGDDAYIYFENREELKGYFDKPFQEDYKSYRQVYLVDGDFNNKLDNPLNALRHNSNANLTDKKVLENPKYTLIYKDAGRVKINVKVNGNTRHSNNKVRKKDELTISWEQPYHDSIIKKGRWDDIGMEFLKIDDYNETIEVKEKSLIPIEKKIYIEISGSGVPIKNAEITCKSNSKEKQVEEGSIINFIGLELKDNWTISAKTGIFSGEKNFTPENESVVKLVLEEKKTTTLKVFYENGDTNRIEKKTEKPYHNQNIKNDSQNYEGRPESDWNKKILIISSLLALSFICFLGLGLFYFTDILKDENQKQSTHENTNQKQPNKDNKEITTLSRAEIEKYLEGDTLLKLQLEQYETDWEKLKPNIEKGPSNNSNATAVKLDSAKYKEWEKFYQSIDRAIKKRIAINEGDFAFFNDNKVNFSSAQQPIKLAINKISTEKYAFVKSKLDDVSTLTLTQIADSINKIIASYSNETSKKTTVEKQKNENQKSNTTNSNTLTKNQEKRASGDDLIIVDYLKGSELKINKLNEYKANTKNVELKKSIDLAVAFWKLDGDNKNTYTLYEAKIKKDPNFRGSVLLDFLGKFKSCENYPQNYPGAGKTKNLSRFIQEATK
jgi:hypothetical protein